VFDHRLAILIGEFNRLRQFGAKDFVLSFQQPVLGGQVLSRTGCEHREKRMNDGPHDGSDMATLSAEIGKSETIIDGDQNAKLRR
jgi:hypothetical protein